LQLPAGYLEDGEEPEACARRELLEETGYVADEWESLGAYCPDGNRGFGQAPFFLARGAATCCSVAISVSLPPWRGLDSRWRGFNSLSNSRGLAQQVQPEELDGGGIRRELVVQLCDLMAFVFQAQELDGPAE